MLSKQETARRAWVLLTTLLESQKRAFDREAEERYGLTQVSAYALYVLSELPPGPIGQLATKLNIDPGWATNIVDKLEQRGTVRRRASTTDRRVRVVEITPEGARIVAQIRDLAVAPQALAALSDRELQDLVRIAGHAVEVASDKKGGTKDRLTTNTARAARLGAFNRVSGAHRRR